MENNNIEKTENTENTAEVMEVAAEPEVNAAPPKKPNKVIQVLDSCLCAYLLIIIGQIFGAIAIVLPFALINIEDEAVSGAISTGVSYFVFIGIWITAFVWFTISKKDSHLKAAMWKGMKGNSIKMLLIGLLLGLVMNSGCILAAILHKDISLSFDSFRPVSFILIFICVFIQSSAEEIITRGFLYDRLKNTFASPWPAIIGNALFFSVIHIFNDGVTFFALLNIFIIGVLCSLIVYYFDSIWCVMAFHTAWNFNQNIIFGLPNSGMASSYSVMKLGGEGSVSFAYDPVFGVEGTAASTVLLVAACVVIYLIGRKRKVS